MRMLFVVMVMLLPALMRAESECSCRLTNFSFIVESEECGSSITIDTTACTGFCMTKEHVYHNPISRYNQTSCNFRDLIYETYEFKGCPAGADSSFTYPVALSCECSKCNSDITDCVAPSQQTTGCPAH